MADSNLGAIVLVSLFVCFLRCGGCGSMVVHICHTDQIVKLDKKPWFDNLLDAHCTWRFVGALLIETWQLQS